MRVVLVDPPFYRFIGYYNRYFPLGLTYLAAVLRNEGHEVLIYDADCNVNPSRMDFARLEDSYPFYLRSLKDANHPIWQEVRETILKFHPDMVGITIWTTFAGSAFRTASLCKEIDEDMPVAMGGPHASIKCDEVMRICPDVDFLVRGEGEVTLLELVKAIDKRWGKRGARFSDIKGISYRQNGGIVHNLDREFIQDMDTIPMPARDLLLNKDSYNPEDMGLMMSSRGCPYNCAFCATSIWRRKTRYRSIDNVIKEINMISNSYGTKQFAFKDDTFTVNRKRVLELANRLMKESIKITWDCNTRVDLIDEELLRKMKEAGCNGIKVGIETGSERVLASINKKTTLSQAIEAANLFRKVGIHWTGYFMMGLPSETKEDVYKTLSFIKELKPDYASFSVYEPFPGTDLFKIGLEKGLVQNDRSLADFYDISPKYYYLKNLKHRVDSINDDEFGRLENEMKRAIHRYNMSFSKLAKRAKSRSRLYLHEPKMLWSDFKKLLAMWRL